MTDKPITSDLLREEATRRRKLRLFKAGHYSSTDSKTGSSSAQSPRKAVHRIPKTK